MTKWWWANYFIPSKILSVYIRDRRLGMRWNRLTNVETKILSHFTGGRGKYTNKEEKVWIMCNWWQIFSQKTSIIKEELRCLEYNSCNQIHFILFKPTHGLCWWLWRHCPRGPLRGWQCYNAQCANRWQKFEILNSSWKFMKCCSNAAATWHQNFVDLRFLSAWTKICIAYE